MAVTSILRKSLLSAGVVVALGFGSTSAMALVLNDFDVNEGVVPGSVANVFTADKITGNYVEVITFDPAGTFQVSLKWQAGQFVGNDGVDPVVTQLNNLGAGGYGLYALYTGTGTWSASGGVTTFVTDAGAGSFGLWLDPNQDTVFGQPADGSTLWSTGMSADDLLLATGTPLPGAGTLDPSLPTCGAGGGVGINCGSFGTSVSFELTEFGMTYFVGPDPFYNISFQSGQLNNFDVAGTQLINGSMDVVFDTLEVPEPGTLALLGLAFAGLGFTARRRND